MYQPYDATEREVALLRRLYNSPSWKRASDSQNFKSMRALLNAWEDRILFIDVYPV